MKTTQWRAANLCNLLSPLFYGRNLCQLRADLGNANGAQYIGIPCAAAKISGQILANFVIRRIGNFVEQRFDRKDKSRRAIGALQRALRHESFLNGVKVLAVPKSFQRQDLTSRGTNGKQEARTHRPAVKQHGTGSTSADAAAFAHDPEFKSVTQHLEKRIGIFDCDFFFASIDLKG